jgi:thymidine kinase
MKSSKSSTLIGLLNKECYSKKRVLLLRPKEDTREFLTRSGLQLNNKIEERKIGPIETFINDFDVIGIDECQFLDPGYVQRLIELANDPMTLKLIFCGLLTYTDLSIPPACLEIIKHADVLIKQNAVCMDCGSEYGIYNYMEGKTEAVHVGDGEYEVFCRDCLNKRKKT